VQKRLVQGLIASIALLFRADACDVLTSKYLIVWGEALFELRICHEGRLNEGRKVVCLFVTLRSPKS
jgi:hypothetical protein